MSGTTCPLGGTLLLEELALETHDGDREPGPPPSSTIAGAYFE
jgi:hypothetical protein